MTRLNETHLEMETRHVAEGEERCARQRALIERMRAAGQDTAEAENLLTNFDDFVRLSRERQQRLLDESQNRA